MNRSEQDRKDLARIFHLLVNDYGVPGKVLNGRNHTNVFAVGDTSYDLRDTEEKFRDAETGELSAQILKHWNLLDQALDYLRREHGLFLEGNLYTTCPIHKYYGPAGARNRRAIYQNKFRAYIQYVGTVAFTCDSRLCPWERCPLHYTKTAKKKDFGKVRFDIFNLLQILDSIKAGHCYPARRRNLDYYRKLLTEAWGLETKALPSSSGEDRRGLGFPKYMGYQVEKAALMKTLRMPTNNDILTDKFLDELRKLIWSNPVEQIYSQTRSPEHCSIHEGFAYTITQLREASRLWFFIWIKCEEGRAAWQENQRDWVLTLRDSRAAYRKYKKTLKAYGCLNEDKQGRLSVSVLKQKT